MTPKPLKKYWIVQYPTGNVAHWSIASLKTDCIANYLEGIGEPGNKGYWKHATSRGHRAVRVNIFFELVTPTKPAATLNPSNSTDWYADPGKSGKVNF